MVGVREGPRLAGRGGGPCQRGAVSGVRGEGGDPGGERPRRSVPGDRRPVGRREKRQTDGERGIPLQQPEGLVAVPGGPQLAGGHRRPDEAENRVSLLYRAEGAGGVQRPGHGGALCGHAVASRAERAPYPGAGDGGEPAAGVVAVLPGPRVEGEGPQPDGKAAQRLPGVRRAGQGEPEISLRIHMGGPTRKRRCKPCLIYHARTQNIHV